MTIASINSWLTNYTNYSPSIFHQQVHQLSYFFCHQSDIFSSGFHCRPSLLLPSTSISFQSVDHSFDRIFLLRLPSNHSTMALSSSYFSIENGFTAPAVRCHEMIYTKNDVSHARLTGSLSSQFWLSAMYQ